MGRLLVVDDEQSLREFLSLMLTREGFDVETMPDAKSAKTFLAENEIDLVLTDLNLPDGSGLDILESVKSLDPDTQVVVITAFGTTETAVEAMKLGAYDYISKPFKNEHITLTVTKALEKTALARENRELKKRISAASAESSILGRSAPMQEVMQLVQRISDTGVTVLIYGDSGTGKELVARKLHEMSGRVGKFVPVNCSAIPEGLIESELFGHVKGSFTGAVSDKPGLFEEAKDGTLFLDEVAELPLALQPKLLRTLQEGTIKRVGGNTELKFNVRIVSATNRDLFEEVRGGRFREDLFYRLNVVAVKLPKLSQRSDDIILLANHFLEKYRKEFGRDLNGITPDAMTCLEQYGFPGNVRELENIIERAVALETGDKVSLMSLPDHLKYGATPDSPQVNPFSDDGLDLDSMLLNTELHYIRKALEKTGGNKTRAAELLGMSFRSLRYRLEKLNISE